MKLLPIPLVFTAFASPALAQTQFDADFRSCIALERTKQITQGCEAVSQLVKSVAADSMPVAQKYALLAKWVEEMKLQAVDPSFLRSFMEEANKWQLSLDVFPTSAMHDQWLLNSGWNVLNENGKGVVSTGHLVDLLKKQLGARDALSVMTHEHAFYLFYNKEYDKAVKSFQEALRLVSNSPDHFVATNALGGLLHASRDGRLESVHAAAAIQAVRCAKLRLRNDASLLLHLQQLLYIGVGLDRTMARKERTEFFDTLVEIANRLAAKKIRRDPDNQYGLMEMIGLEARERGDFRGARGYTAGMMLHAGSQLRRGWVYHRLGECAVEEGDFELAVSLFSRELDITKAEGFIHPELPYLPFTIGLVQICLADYRSAKESFLDTLEMARVMRASDLEFSAKIRYWVGVSEFQLGRPGAAEEQFLLADKAKYWASTWSKQALELEAETRMLLAQGSKNALQLAEDCLADAKRFNEGRPIGPNRFDLQRLPDLFLLASEAAELAGKPDKAEEHLRSALTESERSSTAYSEAAELRRSRATSQAASRLAYHMALRGEVQSAYLLLARHQAMAFEKQVVLREFQQSPEGQSAVQALNLAVANEQKILEGSFADEGERASLRMEVIRLRKLYDDRLSVAAGKLQVSAEPTAAERGVLGTSKSVVLQYVETPQGLGCFLDDGQKVSFRRLAGTRESVVSDIKSVRSFLAAPEESASGSAALKRLSAILIPFEIEGAIAAADRVAILPAGPIWQVPFAALDFRGKPLGIEKGLVQDTSVRGVLSALADRTPATAISATAFGGVVYQPAETSGIEDLYRDGRASQARLRTALNMRNLPSLPGTLTEAEKVAAIWKGGAVSGQAATESQLRSALANSTIVHVASHGIYDQVRPQYSGLVLSRQAKDSPEDDGALLTYEIDSLPIKAKLVVLSACNSAQGEVSDGEGLMGFSRALRAGGVRSLVSTLWPVSDSVMQDMMISFHQSVKAGVPIDKALSQAREAAAKAHPHPFYWAGVILQGSPNPLTASGS